MYQVKFNPEEFASVVPWLMLNRAGLNILVHPETTDAYTDHAVNALWLGAKLPAARCPAQPQERLASFQAAPIHAIRPAARHLGAAFSSTISTSVRNSTSSAAISRLIRARCGLFSAISRASGGKPRFL